MANGHEDATYTAAFEAGRAAQRAAATVVEGGDERKLYNAAGRHYTDEGPDDWPTREAWTAPGIPSGTVKALIDAGTVVP